MIELVFLLEEPSMKIVLDTILPNILPEGTAFTTIKHYGKSDLEKSIPIKLRAFQKPGVKFIILRDQDCFDCMELKQHIIGLCEEGRRPDSMVRIVCHELEAWFLGDLAAVERAFNIRGLGARQNEAKFRDPDRMSSPAHLLGTIVSGYQKISGAREISKEMNVNQNRSKSFNVFIAGVLRLVS